MSQDDTTSPSIVKCEVCQATWIDGQLFWSTGKQGRDIDLAGLVCNMVAKMDSAKAAKCINKCKGNEGGDTWADRLKFIDENSDWDEQE